jgi:transposase
VNGLKRHLVVDTTGLVLAVVVREANIQDMGGAKLVLAKLRGQLPHLAYLGGRGLRRATDSMGGGGAGWLIESVARRKEKQFVVLPRRWVSGADFCLVGVVWAVEQGLPGSATEQRSFDLHCHDASHAGQAVIGMKVSVTTSPGVHGGAGAIALCAAQSLRQSSVRPRCYRKLPLRRAVL